MFIIVKFLGSVLVLGASGLLGFYLAGRQRYRMEDLTQWKKALLLLKGEIGYASRPLPQAMEEIAGRVGGPVSDMLRLTAQALYPEGESAGDDPPLREAIHIASYIASYNAYTAWETALRQVWPQTYLLKEDMDSLLSFGKTLGFLDKEMQERSIDQTVDYLDTACETIRAASEKTGRMLRGAGLLGGLLVCVIFF